MSIRTTIRTTAGKAIRKVEREAVAATSWSATAAPLHQRAWEEGGRGCLVCGWTGVAFEPPFRHCEGERCPRCGSIGRDRFLLHSMASRVAWRPGLRLLETSPRMGEDYRAAMGRWFDYTTSDFDERAHKGAVRIDLQAIDLPDRSYDVVCTAHVLEHVPETDRALTELHRILVPGGTLILQIPLLQAATAPPTEPEFHGDDTPVFWRFGFDLTDRLRSHGFEVDLLCTDEMLDLVRAGASRWPAAPSPEFDADALVAGAAAHESDLVPIASRSLAARNGFDPAYMYFTWACRRPVGAQR